MRGWWPGASGKHRVWGQRWDWAAPLGTGAMLGAIGIGWVLTRLTRHVDR